METTVKTVLLLAAALTGAAPVARARVAPLTPIADTATVRLHISGMSCGTCPLTARLAIEKLPGVYAATVTLDDSLGVVRYDAARVTPDQIAVHLDKMTGFKARVLPEPNATPRKPGE